MFCRNYSVVAAILMALRSMTFNLLYQEDCGGEELKNTIKHFGLHKKMSKFAAKTQGLER